MKLGQILEQKGLFIRGVETKGKERDLSTIIKTKTRPKPPIRRGTTRPKLHLPTKKVETQTKNDSSLFHDEMKRLEVIASRHKRGADVGGNKQISKALTLDEVLSVTNIRELQKLRPSANFDGILKGRTVNR